MAGQKNRIKSLRQERGLAGSNLAKIIGTSAPHMSRLENGQSPLSLAWIAKLSEALKVGSHEIIDLPFDRKFTGTCDDALLGSILGWLMDATDKHKAKLSPQGLAKWASYIYKEAVEQPLDFKQAKYLAFTVVKILQQAKK